MFELPDLSLSTFLILFFVAIIAGFIDTLVGGGGLITVPALLAAGLPPLHALGTNKFQSSFGTGTATFLLFRQKRIHWRDVKMLMLAAFIGSLLGTIVVQFISTDALSFLIPCVLAAISLYFIFSPSPTQANRKAPVSEKKYQTWIVPSIGAYDGMFGPGTGSFFSLAGIACRGQDILHSTAVAKSMNFATNFASLLVFLVVGKIFIYVGLVMMLGQWLGASVGAHVLFKVPRQLLRYLVVLMCLSMLIFYFIQQ